MDQWSTKRRKALAGSRTYRCGSPIKSYVEHWSASVTFLVDEPGFGILDHGDPCGVSKVCQKGHQTRIFGVHQITEVVDNIRRDTNA